MEYGGYRTISGIVFGLICLGHAIRAVMEVPAQLGATAIPIWVSWVAVVIAGGLCIWAFRSPARNRPAA